MQIECRNLDLYTSTQDMCTARRGLSVAVRERGSRVPACRARHCFAHNVFDGDSKILCALPC